jgi:serine/threonine protein kinase
MQIGDYACATPFLTAGSGNARWCMALKDEKQYFLKQFLAPVQPVQTTSAPTRQVLLRRQKCAAFETRKIRLYDALKRVSPNHVVQVDDFFVSEGHYYAASAYLGAEYRTLDTYQSAQAKEKLQLLVSLSEALRALHTAGIIHADLKPEHIVVEIAGDAPRVRLIDFDSGFAEKAPPEAGGEFAIDPVYLSPEAYRMVAGRNVRLNRKLDTFAFGILIHQTMAGEPPGFDRAKYSYLYAAVLDGAKLAFSQEIAPELIALVRRMLKKHPAFRPGDDAIVKKLQEISL